MSIQCNFYQTLWQVRLKCISHKVFFAFNIRRQRHFQLDTHSHGPHLHPGGSWGDFWVTTDELSNLYKREQEIRIWDQMFLSDLPDKLILLHSYLRHLAI